MNSQRHFTVTPNSINVAVVDSDIMLSEQFTVIEFSIKGRVLSPKKTGVKDVRVKLDAKDRAKTDENGEYTLDSVLI